MKRTPRRSAESSASLLGRITVDRKILVGKPIIRGTRISVEFVIDLLASGWTTAEILDEYDHLKAEDIRACFAYASEVLRGEKSLDLSTRNCWQTKTWRMPS